MHSKEKLEEKSQIVEWDTPKGFAEFREIQGERDQKVDLGIPGSWDPSGTFGTTLVQFWKIVDVREYWLTKSLSHRYERVRLAEL